MGGPMPILQRHYEPYRRTWQDALAEAAPGFIGGLVNTGLSGAINYGLQTAEDKATAERQAAANTSARQNNLSAQELAAALATKKAQEEVQAKGEGMDRWRSLDVSPATEQVPSGLTGPSTAEPAPASPAPTQQYPQFNLGGVTPPAGARLSQLKVAGGLEQGMLSPELTGMGKAAADMAPHLSAAASANADTSKYGAEEGKRALRKSMRAEREAPRDVGPQHSQAEADWFVAHPGKSVDNPDDRAAALIASVKAVGDDPRFKGVRANNFAAERGVQLYRELAEGSEKYANGAERLGQPVAHMADTYERARTHVFGLALKWSMPAGPRHMSQAETIKAQDRIRMLEESIPKNLAPDAPEWVELARARARLRADEVYNGLPSTDYLPGPNLEATAKGIATGDISIGPDDMPESKAVTVAKLNIDREKLIARFKAENQQGKPVNMPAFVGGLLANRRVQRMKPNEQAQYVAQSVALLKAMMGDPTQAPPPPKMTK